MAASGNRNESPLLREALPEVMRIVREIGMDLSGTIVSLDGVYDCRVNRKAIFNRGMVPNINPNSRGRKQPKRGRGATGVDPVRWTPFHLRWRCDRCRRATRSHAQREPSRASMARLASTGASPQ